MQIRENLLFQSLGLMFLERGIQSDSGLTCQPLSHCVWKRVHKQIHTSAHAYVHVTPLNLPGVLAERKAGKKEKRKK